MGFLRYIIKRSKAMDKNTVLKITGVVGVGLGSVCLFLSGAGEAMVTALVGGVFVLAGLVTAFFKAK